MAATNIENIFSQIKKDFVKLSKDAARDAAKKAQIDIATQANKFISEYYEYKPKVYKNRKNALYKLVQRYYKEKETKRGMVIEFGVEYNPTKIKNLHTSNSWWHRTGTKWIPRGSSGFNEDGQDNGIPEPEWITNNFLAGVHYEFADGRKIQDAQSPDEKMQSFFDNQLDNLIGSYMSTALYDAVRTYF